MNLKGIDFVNKIVSNSEMCLEPCCISLADINSKRCEGVYFREEFDGNELVISGISNFSIIGSNNEECEIVTEPSYATVLNFETCNNVALSNIKIGHSPKSGYCTGGVLDFSYCYDIVLDSLILYGCGTYGIELSSCANITIKNTTIKECTYGIFSVVNCKNIIFENCRFENNLAHDSYIRNVMGISFKNCTFRNNQKESFSSEYLLHVHNAGYAITMENCIIDNMESFINLDDKSVIDFKD